MCIFAAKSKEVITFMRKTTLILAFLAAVACVQAQSFDSVLHKNFEIETDSILYEMSVAEGAQDIYRVEDAEHYDDYNKTPFELKIFSKQFPILEFSYFCTVDKGSVFIVKLPMSAVLVIPRNSLIHSGFFLKSKAVSLCKTTLFSHNIRKIFYNVELFTP